MADLRNWEEAKEMAASLTAEQVADALAFYLEHQDEIDRYIQEQAHDTEPEV